MRNVPSLVLPGAGEKLHRPELRILRNIRLIVQAHHEAIPLKAICQRRRELCRAAARVEPEVGGLGGVFSFDAIESGAAERRGRVSWEDGRVDALRLNLQRVLGGEAALLVERELAEVPGERPKCDKHGGGDGYSTDLRDRPGRQATSRRRA